MVSSYSFSLSSSSIPKNTQASCLSVASHTGRHSSIFLMQRHPSFHGARRVSAAIASRLSHVFDKSSVGPDTDSYRPSLPSNTLSSVSAQVITLRPDIQAECDAAIPAEPPTEYHIITEHEYPHLRALRTDEDIGDGLWLCCFCAHENVLRHYRGRFPFKFLTCVRCQRLLCHYCHTSDILRPWAFGLIHAPPAVGPDQEVRYCQMCPRCGLTQRAEQEGAVLDFYSVTCAGCGTSGFGDWIRFRIGKADAYRKDPDGVWAELKERRAEDGVRIAIERCMDEVRPERPLSMVTTNSEDNEKEDSEWEDETETETEREWEGEENSLEDKKERENRNVEETNAEKSAENDEPRKRHQRNLSCGEWSGGEVEETSSIANLAETTKDKELDELSTATEAEDIDMSVEREAGLRVASEIWDNEYDGFNFGFK